VVVSLLGLVVVVVGALVVVVVVVVTAAGWSGWAEGGLGWNIIIQA